MSEKTFRVVIKSPNDKLSTQSVDCCKNWTVKDLKIYLSENYYHKPAPSSQRLIHTGRLLKDDILISSLFKDVCFINNNVIIIISLMSFRPFT